MSIALLAGCGGGGSGQATETSGQTTEKNVQTTAGGGSAGKTEAGSLGKAEFIKEEDTLCAADKARAKKAFFIALETHVNAEKETKAQHKAHDIALLEAVLGKELRRQIAEMRALTVSAGREAEVRAFLAAMETSIAKAANNPASLIRFRGPDFARTDQLAREYGFLVCGRSK